MFFSYEERGQRQKLTDLLGRGNDLNHIWHFREIFHNFLTSLYVPPGHILDIGVN